MASEDVRHLVSRDIIEAAVKKCVSNGPFSIQKTRVTRATDEIQGFTSIILRVSVDFTVGGNVRTVSLIVKRLPIVEVQLKLMSELNLFEREAFYYQTLVPKLTKYCEPPLPLAACYYARYDGTNDVLVFEDLQSSNFKTLGFKSPVGLQHCKLVVRELAKLHAASVAVEIDSGEKLDKLFPILKEDALFPKVESNATNNLKPMIGESVNVILAVCEEIPKFKHLIPAMKSKLDTMWDQLRDMVKPRTDQMNVLCHGDCWFNNMMFRFDDNGQPIDVKFIDLQVTRYASPFTDILYFFHMSLERNIWVPHVNDILEEYIASFNRCIEKYDIPIKSLQFGQVKRDYDAVKLYGVLIYASFKPILLLRDEIMPTSHNADNEKFENMFFGERTSAAKAKFNSDANFREEMYSIIAELRDFYKL